LSVLVLLANGFEDIEALSVIDVLRRAKIEVDLVSIDQREVVSSSDVHYLFSKTINDIDVKDYQLLFLPGGRGVKLLDESTKVRDIIRQFYDSDRYIAAICAAPSILGKMGLLNHKSFTCFPGFERHCQHGKYHLVDVIQDGNIITGRGVAYAMEFGLYLVKLLSNTDTYNDVYERTLMKEKME
jgi:4-methyl-5(b-hydroxyethyl)-thiazole monophosphate biosynthesis